MPSSRNIIIEESNVVERSDFGKGKTDSRIQNLFLFDEK